MWGDKTGSRLGSHSCAFELLGLAKHCSHLGHQLGIDMKAETKRARLRAVSSLGLLRGQR